MQQSIIIFLSRIIVTIDRFTYFRSMTIAAFDCTARPIHSFPLFLFVLFHSTRPVPSLLTNEMETKKDRKICWKSEKHRLSFLRITPKNVC
jgi:hypothetical protein